MKRITGAFLLCLAVFTILAVSGCGDPMLNMGVQIDGEITQDDDYDIDRNDLMFYFDGYRFAGKADTLYEVEIISREGDPIHFKVPDLDLDLYSNSDSNTAQFITPDTAIYWCDVYLRSDFVGSGSSYRLTITEL